MFGLHGFVGTNTIANFHVSLKIPGFVATNWPEKNTRFSAKMVFLEINRNIYALADS